MANLKIDAGYWEDFQVNEEDVEFLYNYLLEEESPLTPRELIHALVEERLRREQETLAARRSSNGDVYLPKEHYQVDQKLVFPVMDWRPGQVTAIRPGKNPDLGEFEVIQVKFDDGEQKEFASGLEEHALNAPPEDVQQNLLQDIDGILEEYGDDLIAGLEDELETNPGFVRIAGRWFPRALLVDVNVGHLNLAEAVLDMTGGGPAKTRELIEQIDLSSDVNPKLVEFSLDLALQEDPRFDEVGSSGDVLWFLNRLEPAGVLETPLYLRYQPIEYEHSLLTPEMVDLERELDDELSPFTGKSRRQSEAIVNLIFPHWRSGTLPLSSRVRHLFPTAYESPRIRFTLVDGETGDRFPGWVVREKRYVFGLSDWYESRGLMPGSQIHIRRGEEPGEVIINTAGKRSTREWIRTVLVGSDGGIVFAMLKQVVNAAFDERMAIAIPDVNAIDAIWQEKPRKSFERVVIAAVRELAKLNPQSHVHATEVYAAINVVRRCPPGPILALLASRPGIVHVGDLHFRIDDSE